MDKADFIKAYTTQFDVNAEFQAFFEMGGILDGRKRVRQVVDRFKEIADFVFHDKEVWVLLSIWGVKSGAKEDLEKCGFKMESSTEHWEGKLEDGLIDTSKFAEEALEDKEFLEELGIRYLKYEKYSFDAIRPLIQAIAGHELGLKRSANVTAYFLTFEGSHTMLNLYDDRDVELLSDNEVYVEQISREFNRYRSQDGC